MLTLCPLECLYSRLGSTNTDKMSKATLQDAKVINIITNTLLNVQGDYMVGNSEWNNGTRSDVVLEAKASTLDLPL